MTKQTRNILKGYFTTGNIPTEQNFTELIGSMVNFKDDGLEETPDGKPLLKMGDSKSTQYLAAKNEIERQIDLFKKNEMEKSDKTGSLLVVLPIG